MRMVAVKPVFHSLFTVYWHFPPATLLAVLEATELDFELDATELFTDELEELTELDDLIELDATEDFTELATALETTEDLTALEATEDATEDLTLEATELATELLDTEPQAEAVN